MTTSQFIGPNFNYILRMHNCSDVRSKNRELTKFYDKIRRHLDDLQLEPDEKSQLTYDELSNRVLSNKLEEKLYGKITKDEFERILDSYNKQQQFNDQKGESVACDTVFGRNYAKLLNSKPGFYHSGSTAYLIQDLDLNNVHRNSFLGGHSTYATREYEDLEGLRKNHNRLLIKRSVKKALDHMDQNEYELAKNEIDKALKIDPANGDTLVVRGRYYAAIKRYHDAIDDYKKSLRTDLKDINLVKLLISDSLYQYGIIQYYRTEWQKAFNLFKEAIEYNKENEGAQLHIRLCGDKIKSKTLFAPKPHTYRK